MGIKKNLKCLAAVFIGLSFTGISQTTTGYTSSGTYTWTAPCDVTSVQVECWGAGGSGGGATGNVAAGGGGSGGAYVKHTAIPVTPGTTYTITVGSGGSGSTGAGAAGGVSWFSSATTIQAIGGAGGALASSNNSTASGASAVTTGNACSVAGSVNYYGGAGGTGGALGASGGGGGSSAGTGSAGNAGSGLTGGTAVTGGGAGGSGSATGGNGNNGNNPGGGGSGGRANNGSDRSGYNGGDGKVLLTYTTVFSHTYCSTSFSTSEAITNVTFAGINNTTSGTGASDYEQFCSSGSVVLGSSNNVISVAGNTVGNFSDYISVFIDWDQSGTFDSGESTDIGTITNCTSCSVSSTISVPCSATLGTTTMRVIKKYSSSGTYPTACISSSYGQTEDYVLTVTAAPGSSTPANQPSALSLSAVSGAQVNGSFTAAASSPTNYLVLRTSTSTAPSPVPVDGTAYTVGGTAGTGTVVSVGTTTSFSATGLSSNTAYWFWIYSYNGACTPKYLTTSPLNGTVTTLNVINWNGAGVSGGTTGTDFNTAANWSPTTVPGANDMANITTTTAATITLSADIAIGSLTILNNATGSVTLALDATTKVLTVNGNLLANINTGGGSNTLISFRVGNSPGNITVKGTTTLGNNTNANSFIGFTGSAGATTTGTVTFKGDTYFGLTYGTLSNYIGAFIWDGTGAQTIYTNSSFIVGLNGTCQIGNANTPTVTLSPATITSMNVAGSAGICNLIVKAGSTLDLGSKYWNKSTSGSSVAGGVFTLEAGAKIKLGANTGGQTGSNFPSGFTTSSPVLSATSTVEYNATSDQTIYDVASPGYGHLTLTGNSIKSATGGLDIQGNLIANSTSTFAAGTSLSHTVGGDWTNNGTFSYTTNSTVSFTGSSNQTIGGTSTTSFYNLTNSNTSTGLTLNRGILVSNTLSMSGATANINLNGYNIDLSTAGSISGESNTDRIYGTSGLITTTRPLSNISALDIGGMGCVLTTTANMGSTTISRGHTASSGSGLVNNTIKRYYIISPTTNTGLNATMQFNYFDNELNSLSSHESHFELYRSTDGGSTWTERFGSVTAASNYVTLTGISAFSTWTVSYATVVALPISLITFDAKKVDRTNVISWVTMTEFNNDFFTIERSTDGKTFEAIAIKDGAGTSSEINQYEIVDTDFAPEINYYRLLQTDFDGQSMYSNLVSVDNREIVKSVSKVINLYGQEVDEHFNGVVIIVYKDGTILKTVQNP